MNLPRKSTGLGKLLLLSLWLIGLCSIACITALLAYLYSAQSNISSKRTIKSLGDAIAITFNEVDIPHIKAKSQADAYFAL